MTDGAPAPGADGARSAPLSGSRAYWQIRLRWLVPPAIVIGGLVARHLGLGVDLRRLLGAAAFILAYNIAFWWLLGRGDGALVGRPRGLRDRVSDRSAVLQVLLDYLATFALIHWTGGIASPLVAFLYFHVVVAAILLPAGTAWLFAMLAAAGLALLAVVEGLALPPPSVFGVAGQAAGDGRSLYVAAELGVFATMAFALAGAVTAIMSRLRQEQARALWAAAQLESERSRTTRQLVHNLRAPIGAAATMLDLVRSGALGPLNDAQVEYLERSRARLVSLGHGLGDLLTLSRTSRSDAAAFGVVEVGALAQRVVEAFSQQASDAGVRLDVTVGEGGAAVMGDGEDLSGLLENLVSNAIKYTPSDGKVTVTVGERAGVVRIEVADTGIGVPPEEQGRLFEEYFRASNARATDAAGTGLGLAIVRSVAERHGGRVTVDTALGRGTTFTVLLPASRGGT